MKIKCLPLWMCLFLSFRALAQSDSSSPRISNDTLYTTVGFKVTPGQKLKLSQGTMPDGSFKYIRINSASIFAYYSNVPNYANSANSMNRSAAGHEYKVGRIEKRGNKKIGDVYYAILYTPSGRYECDIENAIAVGEVVVPNEFKKSSTVPAGPSLGDELKKLKDLFDQGALTKEEYDAAKKKLLN